MNKSSTATETAQTLLKVIGHDPLLKYFSERLRAGRDLSTRPRIISAYSQLAGAKAIELLTVIAQDANERTTSRTAAITALGHLPVLLAEGPSKSHIITLLTELLRDSNQEICSSSAIGLMRLGAKEAVHHLLQVYEEKRLDVLSQEELRKFLSTSKTFSSAERIIPNIESFVGRSRELQALKAAFANSPIVAIVGLGGIGKTALAAKYTRETAYDVKIWLSCVNESDLADLATETIRQIDMWVNASLESTVMLNEDSQVFDWQEAQSKIIETLLHRNALLVIDSYEAFREEHELVQFIRSITEALPRLHCLITGRQPLEKLAGESITLQGLTLEETRLMLLGTMLTSSLTQDQFVSRIFQKFQGMPLALRIASRLPPDQLESVLSDQIELSLRSIVDQSLGRLTIAQRRALEVIAQFDEPVNLEDSFLVSLLERELVSSSPQVLQSLMRSSLISSTKEGATIVHDLIRTLVRQQTDLRTSLRVNQAIATFYQKRGDVLWAATHLIRADAPDEAIELVIQHQQDLVNKGHAVITRQLLVETLEKSDLQPRVSMQYANAIGYLSELLGDYVLATSSYESALTITRRTDDRIAEGKLLASLGKVYSDLADYMKAIQVYDSALALARVHGDHFAEATVLTQLGETYSYLKDYSRALQMYEQATEIARETGDSHTNSMLLNNLGIVYLDTNRPEDALQAFEQALVAAQEVGDRRREGAGLSNLGSAYVELNQSERAIKHFEQALVIAREIGDRRSEIAQFDNLGMAYAQLGELQHAIEYFQMALPIAEEIGDRQGRYNLLSNLGKTYASLGEPRQAVEIFERALLVAREIGYPYGEAQALWEASIVLHRLDQRALAIAKAEAALNIFTKLGRREVSQVRADLNVWKTS